MLPVKQAKHCNAVVMRVAAGAEIELDHPSFPNQRKAGAPTCTGVGAGIDLDLDEPGVGRQIALGKYRGIGGGIDLAGFALVDKGTALMGC